VNDKTIRRRRVLLGLLVVLSLILLTAYFGESPGGRLHSVQRGFLTIVSPIQDGANKALKPVRNLFGWVGSTLDAKAKLAEDQKAIDKLRKENIRHRGDERGYQELSKLVKLDERLSISDYHPVTTSVYTTPLTDVWHSTVLINAGSSAGIRENDAVINKEGLIGKVTEVESSASQVSLLTGSAVGVSAEIAESGAEGIIEPRAGHPGQLSMLYLPAGAQVSNGEKVITSGGLSSPVQSLYPYGVPIGVVIGVEKESPYQSVVVQPYVNFHALDAVQVLTKVRGSRAEQLQLQAHSLAPGKSAGETESQLASAGEEG